jgi:hypothetical protein
VAALQDMSTKASLSKKIVAWWRRLWSSTVAKKLGSWWYTISHNPLLSALIAALMAGAVLAIVFGTSSSEHASARSSTFAGRPLRVGVREIPKKIFAIAFPRDIGKPAASETWAALHARGGVDIVKDPVELTLANRSSVRLTVTNVEVVVVRSQPTPAAWAGFEATQGSEGIQQFRAFLTSGSPGSSEPVSMGGTGLNGPSYFRTHDVSLAPGEIYQAVVSVIGDAEGRELEYRFVVSGNTASNPFTVDTGSFRVAGAPIHAANSPSHYPHEYTHVTGISTECWLASLPAHELPHCP